jgi:hypothetical protein
MRKIEEELKAEYYKIIDDKDQDQPSVGKAKAPALPQSKQFTQDEDKY